MGRSVDSVQKAVAARPSLGCARRWGTLNEDGRRKRCAHASAKTRTTKARSPAGRDRRPAG